jgi:hypothetical protein
MHGWLVGCVVAAGCGSGAFGTGGDAGGNSDGPPGPPDARGTTHVDARPVSGGTDAAPSANDLRFAIVGDTRPPNLDDTSGYPTAVISKIWGDVQAMSPPAQFAISTGDYMFASTSGSQQNPQLDLYLNARMQFTGTVYAAMGNHECTGATDSNCGSGTTDGVTKNYTAFMTRMVQPNGFSDPWFEVDVNDPQGAWTAKLVFIAGNAWTSTQATWLDAALAKPTTYTFVVRHEGVDATTAPGVTPSAAIIAKHPLTLLIVGHTHSYHHYSYDHEVICGNGGAPLTSSANYGFGVIDRRTDGSIEFTEHDYQTGAVTDTWAVKADGSYAAP